MILAQHHQPVEHRTGTPPAALNGTIPHVAVLAEVADVGTRAAGMTAQSMSCATLEDDGARCPSALGLPLASRAILMPGRAARAGLSAEGFKKAGGSAVEGLDAARAAWVAPIPRVLPAVPQSIAARDRSIFSEMSFWERYIRPRKRLLSDISDVFLIVATMALLVAVVLRVIGD